MANLFTKMQKVVEKWNCGFFSKYPDKMANNLKQSTSAHINNSVQTLADFEAKFKSSPLYLLPFDDFFIPYFFYLLHKWNLADTEINTYGNSKNLSYGNK